MQQNIKSFIVNPDILNEFFAAFSNKSPFNLKKNIKTMMKEYKFQDEKEFYAHLSLELAAAYKEAKPGDYIYHNGKNFKIAIIKYRMQDVKSNSGKSKGWRVVALVDELNDYFYLLDLYKHSQGKDDLTSEENKKVRQLCDEYVESL